ncbi:hypothetical protein NBO_64g0023 [Nosema bombycis CQ1]|uniref:Uncharacterized protein n=1 Tax=Nosema bombycis (strain CQ1 / CVCC 102059) TaxID=578461 RepID=R0KTS8_NOSB1|nr:hypothetical protein NBO_64g0023 [Nosema bombycis CQ1]|eukprot:EOB13642.1 hypothetical protein NBO_64g0023 [Nosema bombycis CQ1]
MSTLLDIYTPFNLKCNNKIPALYLYFFLISATLLTTSSLTFKILDLSVLHFFDLKLRH